MKAQQTRPREGAVTKVIILGAGYAGLRAALGLARVANVEVTLIDRERTPVVKTRLHELRDSAATVDLDDVLGRTNVKLVEGVVDSILRNDRQIALADGQRFDYDMLVVALGSRASDFGIPGVRDHAILLDGAADGKRLSNAVRRLRREGGRLVVVGGGPTGVEAAGEASMALPRGCVTLVNADARILRGLPRLPAFYARGVLASRGVRVTNRSEVVRLTEDYAVLHDGTMLPYDEVLWSAGVEAHPLLGASSLAEAHRPAPVDDFLVSTRDPNVYVVGDCADASGGEPSAQVAVQMGDFAARDIARRVEGQTRTVYEPKVLGQFVSLGCDATGVLKVGPVAVTLFGPPARILKLAGEARHRLTVKLRTATSPRPTALQRA